MTGYKLGRRPPREPEEAPRLRLGQFLRREALPPAPPVVDWMTRIGNWPMYANDEWGDCVWAMIGHAVEAFTAYGQGRTVEVTDADVLKGYSDVTGFDPNAGPPGDNPTDQGTVIQDALNYWRKQGVGGHKILAFAEVDIHNPAEVDAALAVFGHLMIGVNFPASAMDQFDNGQPWDVVRNDGGIEGGHAVNLGYDAGGKQLKVVTWAQVQPMTSAWWSKYVEEAWAVCSPEWLDATSHSPEGLDVAALNAAFTEITHGEPGPFPVSPQPGPAPTPTPTPVPPGPGPQPDSADLALVAAVDGWAHVHHAGENAKAARAYLAWKIRKGL